MLRSRRLAAALAIALLLALAPAAVRADDEPDSADGFGNLLRYASCAASVYIAQTPGQWVLAITSCAAAYHDAI